MARGLQVSLAYDERVLPLSRSRGALQKLYAYDENGNEVFESVTTETGSTRETIRTFNQNSFMTSSTLKSIEKDLSNSEDLVTVYAPDAISQVQQITMPGGEIQAFEYDHLGRVTKITTGGTHVQEFSYDLNGNKRKVKLSNGGFIGGLLGDIVQEIIYDGHDRPITI
jgi:YD repeat-containing protein